MSGPRGRPGPGKNRLFGILPPSSRDRLWAAGRVESLALGQTLMNEGNRIEHVYFPLTGVISVLVVMRDGRSVDAATIGFEGMVGAPLVLGDEHSPYQVTVLVPGEAL